MHLKNDYGHRDGDRYTTLERLQLLLALESSSTIKEGSDDRTTACTCLLPCLSDPCSTKSSSDSLSSSTLLHAAILDAERYSDDQRAFLIGKKIDDILRSGVDINVRDERGETALSSIKILLRRGCYRIAFLAACHLLDRGAKVDAEDNGHQTLLFHSVASLDAASDLTRLLLNRGADVWYKSEGDSPFSSFLQAIIRRRCVEGASVTADLLGRMMGNRPEAFRLLVLRSMIRHGRYVRVLGPVFVQLKSLLSPYWKQPPSLRYAAWSAIRHHSTGNSWARELQELGLPPSTLRYLTMED